MRITIFGATGGTGKQLVEQALAEGNEVVAFARKPSKLSIMDKNLTIVQGELTDEALIENARVGPYRWILLSLSNTFDTANWNLWRLAKWLGG